MLFRTLIIHHNGMEWKWDYSLGRCVHFLCIGMHLKRNKKKIFWCVRNFKSRMTKVKHSCLTQFKGDEPFLRGLVLY